jgi:SET domain-containing protein
MRGNAVLAVDEFQETPAVEIKDKEGCKGIFAKENISKTSIIFFLRGKVTRRPTRYTIQIGSSRHLAAPAIRKSDDELDYCWLYLNHNCDPNGYVNTDELTFRARRDIAAGDEITFNYLTTESELAAPFTCTCGATHCFGLIKGCDFLTPAEAERLTRVVDEGCVKRGQAPFLTARFPR